MDEFLLRLLSTSASTAILISIAILISKSFLIEKIKNAVKFEYDVELKKLDDDLRRKTEIEISKLNNRMSIELESLKIKLGPYSESQFQIYNELWKSLCEIKYAMFDLWGEASNQNLLRFSKQLFETNMNLEGSALIIEEKHYQDLMEIINTFAEYEIGKKKLIDLRNENNLFIDNSEINQMVDQNRIRKNKLLKLLPNIRKNLRQQISGQNNAEHLL